MDVLQARFSVLSERQLIADVRAVEINAISLNGIEDDIPLAIGLLRLCFTVAKRSRKYFARGRGDYGSFVCLEFVSEFWGYWRVRAACRALTPAVLIPGGLRNDG
jgi:hypothetical protein